LGTCLSTYRARAVSSMCSSMVVMS
jgi:hypothetical protein